MAGVINRILTQEMTYNSSGETGAINRAPAIAANALDSLMLIQGQHYQTESPSAF